MTVSYFKPQANKTFWAVFVYVNFSQELGYGKQFCEFSEI